MATGTITVSAGTTLSTLTSYWCGLNVGVYDNYLSNSTSISVLKALNIPTLRYPGGSLSDAYHWGGMTYTQGATGDPTQEAGTNNAYIGEAASMNNFKSFMSNIAVPMNANVIITANYGSNIVSQSGRSGTSSGGGDPLEIAGWCKWIKAQGYMAACSQIEVGNENYGGWENDQHSAKQDPTTYGNAYIAYRNAIRAVDTTFKVGAVLLCPTPGYNPGWNNTVLGLCGSVVDFVIIHLYSVQPGHENDADILTASYAPSGIANVDSYAIAPTMTATKSLLTTYCGSNPLGAANVPIYVTEFNICPGTNACASTGMVGALFLADGMPTWIENGATAITWWDYHNGADTANASRTSAGAYAWADYGIVSSNSAYTSTHGGPAGQPPDGTLYPTYFALQLLIAMGKAGDALVSVASSQNLVRSHSIKQAGGKLTLLLINTDSSASYTETVTYTGFSGDTVASVVRFDRTMTALAPAATVPATAGGFTDTIAPYSINLYTINAPGTPVSGQTITTSGTAVSLGGLPSVIPGTTITLSTNVKATNTGGPYGLQWLIYDPTGALQATLPRISTGSLTANTSVALSQSYVVPPAGVAGTWTTKAQVMSSDYTTTTYATDSTATNFLVQNTTNQGGNTTPGVGAGLDSQLPLQSPNVIQRVCTFVFGNGQTEISPTIVGADPVGGLLYKLADATTLGSLLSLVVARGTTDVWHDPVGGVVRSATGVSGWQSTANVKYLQAYFILSSLTTTAGTATYTPSIQTQTPSGQTITLWSGTPVSFTFGGSAVATTIATPAIGPGLPIAAMVGSQVQAVWTLAGGTATSATIEAGLIGKW